MASAPTRPISTRKPQGAIIQGDWLNQAGTLRFHVMRDGDHNDLAARSLLPLSLGADGKDFSFSLVF